MAKTCHIFRNHKVLHAFEFLNVDIWSYIPVSKITVVVVVVVVVVVEFISTVQHNIYIHNMV